MTYLYSKTKKDLQQLVATYILDTYRLEVIKSAPAVASYKHIVWQFSHWELKKMDLNHYINVFTRIKLYTLNTSGLSVRMLSNVVIVVIINSGLLF